MPHTPSDLPSADLVDAVSPGRLARFSVGTGPFNAMAMVVLLGISGFVVLASSATPLRAQEAASGAQGTESRFPYTPPGRLAFGDIDPTTSTTAETTTTSEAPTTTTSTTSTTTPKKKAPAPAPSAQFVVRAIRCSDFGDQPTAQRWFDSNRASFAGLDGDSDGTACEDLPGAPGAGAVTAPIRSLSKADLLRPNTRLYGVHTPQSPLASEIDAFAAVAGKSPNMVMFFRDLDDPFPAEAVSASWAGGRLPMVSLEPIIKDSSTGQPKLRDIYTGKFDAFLTQWAQAAAAQDMAFALRFGQEMNGNWYTWSDGQFGNARGDYVKAWRHIHDLFEANGADHIIWNWSVNRIDSLTEKSLTRVYPGDSYVDWVGVSGYFRSAGPAPSFDTTFAMTLAELKRIAPSKLVVLTEVGVGTTEANRVAWINDLFAKLLQHPEIIGFNWFNDFKSGGDWRIGYSTQTEAAFRTGVADARYGSLLP